ncbi:hypothetical protein [Methylomonas sp. UP202]|uniref:hypothetical protein n=1 Tax=Methylomonas sp. UP202 TaxID=3040943 RepID=UPI00247A7177|nr:hypothetical protein [Methylomonas sp. UP202]WGS84777.1 hypothetical protein QC632_17165 [Methylomonas sp. UP202]
MSSVVIKNPSRQSQARLKCYLKSVAWCCVWVASAASAHVESYDLNQGVQIADLTAAGKAISQAQSGAATPQDLALDNPTYWNSTYQNTTSVGVFSGVSYGEYNGGASVQVNDVTDFGWGAGTQATLGDSHKVDFFNFRLRHDAQVDISWTVSAGSSLLDSAFSLYRGLPVYQGHDDTVTDALNPLGAGFVKVQNAKDTGTVVDAQGNLSPFRDTLNNAEAYVGQFNALAGWSQANAAGNWSALQLVQAANDLHTRASNDSTRITEHLAIALAAGDYSIAAGGALLPGSTSFGLSNLSGQLTFSYTFAVPVPAAGWLFASLMPGLLATGRRRKSFYKAGAVPAARI